MIRQTAVAPAKEEDEMVRSMEPVASAKEIWWYRWHGGG